MQAIVESLIKYINRAFDKNRPTLLLVQYDLESDKSACIKSLNEQLGQQNQACSSYDLINDTQYIDGGLYNKLATDSKNNTLSVISSLPLEQASTQLNQEFLNYLNIYRDRITKHNLHIVLFIHSMHMKQFIQDANDLWSFQRKTFWLENNPPEQTASLLELSSLEPSDYTLEQMDNREQIAQYLVRIRQQLNETKQLNGKLIILINAASRVLRHNQAKASLALATEAQTLFTECKGSLEDEDAQEFNAKITKQLAKSYFALERYDEALEYLTLSIHQYQLIEDITAVNHNKELMANIYIEQERYEPAIVQLNELLAYRLKHFSETHPDIINGYTEIAKCYVNVYQYEQAIECFERALTNIVKLHGKNHFDLVDILIGLSTCYKLLGQYDAMLNGLKQALAITQEHGDKLSEGDILTRISFVYKVSAEYGTALKYLNQSLGIAQQINNQQLEGVALNDISQIHITRGDYDSALDYLKQSLAICQETGDKQGEGATLNNVSQIYSARGDNNTALDYLKQSLAISQEIGDKQGEDATLNNISLIYSAKGDNNTALDYLKQSLTINQEIGDKKGEGTTLNNISLIYRARGDNDTAFEYLKQSLAIREEIGDKEDLCITLFNIGHIYFENNEKQQAISTWLKVYGIAKPAGIAQIIQALEKTAESFGIENSLEGWQALHQQFQEQ